MEELERNAELAADLKRVVLEQIKEKYDKAASQKTMCIGAGTGAKKKKSSRAVSWGKTGATAASPTADERAEMAIYLQETVIDGEDDPLI